MEKQLETLHKMQKMLFSLEDLDDDIYSKIEDNILDAITYLEEKIREENAETTEGWSEMYKFNYGNLDSRWKYAG